MTCLEHNSPQVRRDIVLRNGEQLAIDAGDSDDPERTSVLLIHGWCCSSAMFAPQARYLRQKYRVLAPDLRGHGASSAPRGDYTVDTFADDLAWLITQYKLEKPVLVGHSMGGTIALQFAARFPQMTSGIVMIDSALCPSDELKNVFANVAEGLRGPGYQEVLRSAAASLFLPTDDAARKTDIIAAMACTPRHVAHSALIEHLLRYDARWAMARCQCPSAYIATARPLTDLSSICARWPALSTAQALGVGHFAQLEAPDQINAMLDHFIARRCRAPSPEVTA